MTASTTEPIRIRYRATFLLLLRYRRLHHFVLWLAIIASVPLGFRLLIDSIDGHIRLGSLTGDVSDAIGPDFPWLIGTGMVAATVSALAFVIVLISFYWRQTPEQRDVSVEFSPDGLSIIDGQGSSSRLVWSAIRRIVATGQVLRVDLTTGRSIAMPSKAFAPGQREALWAMLQRAGVKTN